jgi:predicted choloylglycine hydrolase
MNDAGLCLAVNEIVTAGDGSPRFDPKGHPMMSTFRRVLEECSTVAEAEKLIRATPRTTMCSVTLCDPNSGVVLEVTSRSVVARPADRGVVACTNHFRSKELSTGEKCPRWEVFEKSFAKEKWTLAKVAKQMDAVNQGKYTLQTMIFEPAALKMQINFGKAPSSSEPLKPFDLKPLLRPTDR